MNLVIFTLSGNLLILNEKCRVATSINFVKDSMI